MGEGISRCFAGEGRARVLAYDLDLSKKQTKFTEVHLKISENFMSFAPFVVRVCFSEFA